MQQWKHKYLGRIEIEQQVNLQTIEIVRSLKESMCIRSMGSIKKTAAEQHGLCFSKMTVMKDG